ncbi:hypothetical protein [Parasulfitobacter algicola]|uniref:IrrE N-terminal-like domain-containing protein n=1 Tax=Parasulfitobacter algicola TaxID=2614809 RepID=A0ABX2IRB4_9RHOB|nr:hypothetical protein [Sulfitobacter algicola]NSX55427.1 hypothetical protein [Sulfitobacter algicola]
MSDWIIENFEWVLARDDNKLNDLILPTKDYFTAPGGQDEKTARAVADDVARHLNIDQKFHIEPLPNLPDEIAHQYGQMSDIAGQYWHDTDEPLITYSPRNMRQPMNFIATMAHEFLHLKLADHEHLLPGGEAMHELTTDLHMIIEGFGVFALEGADQAGWSGYMTQPTCAYALAVFLKFKGLDAMATNSYLSSRPRKYLKVAIANVDRIDLPSVG